MVDTPPPPPGFQLVEGDKPKDSPGLMQRAKDYFATIPNIMDISRGQKTQGGFSPAAEFALGGMAPGKAITKVPAIAEEVTGSAMGESRIGKFFKGIKEKPGNLNPKYAEPKPAPPAGRAVDPVPHPEPQPFEGTKGELGSGRKVGGIQNQTPPKTAPTPRAAKPAEFPSNSTLDPKFHGPIEGTPESAATPRPAEAPKTSRTVRSTPEKQSYSELRQTKARLQASMTHAQNLFKAGQTAEKLKALNPAEKKELMVQLFGRERPEVWDSMIDDLRGLETGRVKPIEAVAETKVPETPAPPAQEAGPKQAPTWRGKISKFKKDGMKL